MALELFGGLVTEETPSVLRWIGVIPLGGEALQFDRADFGAVLFFLTASLRLLVVVQFPLDAGDGAMEEIDCGPEQIFARSGSRRVSPMVATKASKMSATAPATVRASGSGLGSGSSWKGR